VAQTNPDLAYLMLQITKKPPVLKLFIKYMVSIRCKMVVKSELEKLGLEYGVVDLGEVEVKGEISAEQRSVLRLALLKSGLELMDDKKAILIEKIKNVIIEMVHYADEVPRTKNSEYISEKLGLDYTYLANTFSETTGITIEHFIIAHKIERVKEFLLYDELNLTEISYKLNYSSVAHLSNQFKKITGLTPSFFKKLKRKRLTTLEDV
jgi:AraC-like DNA-binding protein